MPAARKRSSRAWWLLLLLLLLMGTGGGAAWWRIQHKGNATALPAGSIMANGNGAGQVGTANGATGATGASSADNGATGPAGVSNAGNGAGAAGSTTASAESAAAPAASSSGAPAPATASIVDAPSSDRNASALATADARRAEEDKPPSNPLSALTAPTAAIPPQQVALADKGKVSDGKSADGKGSTAKGDGKSAARNSHTSKAKKKADGDTALLSALMSYGLPPPTSATATAAALPGTPLAERLQQCRRKPFLESEQCRLQVCAGQWGLAPECPNPQAQSQMPKRP